MGAAGTFKIGDRVTIGPAYSMTTNARTIHDGFTSWSGEILEISRTAGVSGRDCLIGARAAPYFEVWICEGRLTKIGEAPPVCATHDRALDQIDEWKQGAHASPGRPADGINYGNACAAEVGRLSRELIAHIKGGCEVCKANKADETIHALRRAL